MPPNKFKQAGYNKASREPNEDERHNVEIIDNDIRKILFASSNKYLKELGLDHKLVTEWGCAIARGDKKPNGFDSWNALFKYLKSLISKSKTQIGGG